MVLNSSGPVDASTRPHGAAHLNVRFALLQGAYFLMYCAINAFIANNLLSYGISHAVVGMAIAVGAVGSSLIQPPLGRVLDRRGLTPRRLLFVLFTVGTALSLALPFIQSTAVVTCLYVILFIIGQTAQPFVNVQGLSLGAGVNFGLARSFGSLAYAVAAVIIGVVIANLGMAAYDVTMAAFFVACDACLLLFPASTATDDVAREIVEEPAGQDAEADAVIADAGLSAEAEADAKAPAKDPTREGHGGFVRRYPLFVAALAAAFFILCGHNGIGIYLIDFIGDLGGNSQSLGVATAVAACVEVPFMANYQRIRQALSCTAIVAASGTCFFLKSLATMLATSIPMIYGAQLLQALAYALFLPALVELAGHAVEERDSVTAQALVTTTITISFAAASLAGAALQERFGSHATLLAIVTVSAVGALALVAMAPRMRAAFHGCERLARLPRKAA